MALKEHGTRAPAAPYATNEAWLDALRGGERDGALRELRALLVRGLRVVLVRRVPREAEALAEDVAQEALLQILDSLDSFRGASRFTTWAQKIAVNIALSKLRRKRWENVSLADLMPDDAGHSTLPALEDGGPDPEEQTAQHLLVERVERVIRETLTDHQRTALLAVKVHGMPMEEAARRLGISRNALYKLIYDARQRLQHELKKRGLPPESILAELEDR